MEPREIPAFNGWIRKHEPAKENNQEQPEYQEGNQEHCHES